jgi:broad specificity phosphatase PhoE
VEDLRAHLKYPLESKEDVQLNPQNLGTYPHRKDRKTTSEYAAYKNQKQDKKAQFALPPGPGAESKQQLYARVSTCVALQVSSADSDTLVVFVTHDKPMQAYFKGLKHAKTFTDSTDKTFFKNRPAHGELFMLKKEDEQFSALERKI